MSTSIQSAGGIGTAGTRESLSLENRQKLADLAAEFESMLLNQVVREMSDSGKWGQVGDQGDTLGAETFNQTFQMELSRVLARAGGLGLSQQLMKAFDAMAGTTAAVTGGAATVSARATGAAPLGAGWNGLRLDAPAAGGSGAQWAGFNTERAMAGGNPKSVKDAFYRWTQGLDFNPAGHSKAEIEEYLKGNLASARAYGLNILDVENERILVETRENGPEWIDVVASVNGKDPADVKWQWHQVEGAEMGGGLLGEALNELRGLPGGTEAARAVMADGRLTGDALLRAMQGEIAAVRSGVTRPAAASQTMTVSTSAADLSLPASRVTSAYGWRQDPFTGEAKFHKGTDFQAPEGSDIHAAGAGRVTFSGADGAYGTSVIVQHANGLSTRYAHLSEALVRVGDDVADRQVIGLAGRTGRATAAHLHFEVLENGVHVDPLR
jgi:murein DD-endopeptidase MepM/ murein hydrolase activator NlpD/Rod binding domain-containing protein